MRFFLFCVRKKEKNEDVDVIFDKNAIFEKYFLYTTYVNIFESKMSSEILYENRRICVNYVKCLHKVQTMLKSK